MLHFKIKKICSLPENRSGHGRTGRPACYGPDCHTLMSCHTVQLTIPHKLSGSPWHCNIYQLRTYLLTSFSTHSFTPSHHLSPLSPASPYRQGSSHLLTVPCALPAAQGIACLSAAGTARQDACSQIVALADWLSWTAGSEWMEEGAAQVKWGRWNHIYKSSLVTSQNLHWKH